MNLATIYLETIKKTFISMKKLGDKTIEQLSLSEMNWIPNSESNSVSIIMKHLAGNMRSRWTDFLTSDGEKTTRDRDKEFINENETREALINSWEQGWIILFGSLEQLKHEDLTKNVYIRGEAHSVVDAIERQVSHYAYHIGQIVYIGKAIKGHEWNNLSIPKDQSEQFREDMMRKFTKDERLKRT